jgi:hypothetical protein
MIPVSPIEQKQLIALFKRKPGNRHGYSPGAANKQHFHTPIITQKNCLEKVVIGLGAYVRFDRVLRGAFQKIVSVLYFPRM